MRADRAVPTIVIVLALSLGWAGAAPPDGIGAYSAFIGPSPDDI